MGGGGLVTRTTTLSLRPRSLCMGLLYLVCVFFGKKKGETDKQKNKGNVLSIACPLNSPLATHISVSQFFAFSTFFSGVCDPIQNYVSHHLQHRLSASNRPHLLFLRFFGDTLRETVTITPHVQREDQEKC
eukprot:Hpha_TRINITY_DN15390_c1_g2::TRINITY_DN15390_c1_g2_i1::g.92062::m.92062